MVTIFVDYGNINPNFRLGENVVFKFQGKLLLCEIEKIKLEITQNDDATTVIGYLYYLKDHKGSDYSMIKEDELKSVQRAESIHIADLLAWALV